jgi:hypothetical protein
MTRRELRVGAVYQDTARVGRRVITMIADGYVFFTTVRQGLKGRGRGFAYPVGTGAHSKITTFVKWADKEVGHGE